MPDLQFARQIVKENHDRILAEYATGRFLQSELAKKYGLHQSTICRIVNPAARENHRRKNKEDAKSPKRKAAVRRYKDSPRGQASMKLLSGKHNAAKHGYVPPNATIDEVEKLIQSIHACEVCGDLKEVCGGLVLDHCHDTGAVRGLICSNCNFVLGHAKDNPSILWSAVRYLGRVKS